MSDCMQVSGCVSGTLLSCLCVFVKINLPWCLRHGPLKKNKNKKNKIKKIKKNKHPIVLITVMARENKMK